MVFKKSFARPKVCISYYDDLDMLRIGTSAKRVTPQEIQDFVATGNQIEWDDNVPLELKDRSLRKVFERFEFPLNEMSENELLNLYDLNILELSGAQVKELGHELFDRSLVTNLSTLNPLPLVESYMFWTISTPRMVFYRMVKPYTLHMTPSRVHWLILNDFPLHLGRTNSEEEQSAYLYSLAYGLLKNVYRLKEIPPKTSHPREFISILKSLEHRPQKEDSPARLQHQKKLLYGSKSPK